jgi:tRNA 2-thiouridine synthesizing protein C
MPAEKEFCFVIRHAPDDRFRIGELLDMALTAAAFDQTVTVVFLDDGVLHLLLPQNEQKNQGIIQIIAAFDLYDIHSPWVETESLLECGITLTNLAVPVRCINRADVARLLARQHILVAA